MIRENQSITEQSSEYDHLENMSIRQLLDGINREDAKVALAVQKAIPQVESLVEQMVKRMKRGGRIFYLGAGTSGRLGVLDASELPPTYGIPANRVIGLIAGGDRALRCAVEAAEDDARKAWEDLEAWGVNEQDTVIGIAASGRTPYVVGGIKQARLHGILTGSISCNPHAPVSLEAEYPIEAVVGPEFVTGSTRMKSGTAQKMLLNMISTTVMIKLGRVKGNKMVNMQLTNEKLVERGVRMIVEETAISPGEAYRLLLEYGSVKEVLNRFRDEG